MRYRKASLAPAILLIILGLSSCIKPKNFRMRNRYVVSSNVLRIRSAPSTSSKVLSYYHNGDTVIANSTHGNWIGVRVKGQNGFVSVSYLTPIEQQPTPKSFRFLEDLTDWTEWYFWPATFLLLMLWLTLSNLSLKLKQHLVRRKGVPLRSLLFAPVVFFVNGVLTAVLYINWKDQVILSIQNSLQFYPDTNNLITWVIWVELLILLLAVFIDLLGNIIVSGSMWGILVSAIDLTTSSFILITSYFLTLSLYYYAIVFLILFFGSIYVINVNRCSKFQVSNRYTSPE